MKLDRRKKVLFICTANRYRSRTAHELFEKDETLDVKSCGCIDFYVKDTKKWYWDRAQTINQGLLEDADQIFVMDKGHIDHISKNFGDMFEHKIVNLNIDDVYEYNDPELIKLLTERIKINE